MSYAFLFVFGCLHAVCTFLTFASCAEMAFLSVVDCSLPLVINAWSQTHLVISNRFNASEVNTSNLIKQVDA